jgi:hypothetical protein
MSKTIDSSVSDDEPEHFDSVPEEKSIDCFVGISVHKYATGISTIQDNYTKLSNIAEHAIQSLKNDEKKHNWQIKYSEIFNYIPESKILTVLETDKVYSNTESKEILTNIIHIIMCIKLEENTYYGIWSRSINPSIIYNNVDDLKREITYGSLYTALSDLIGDQINKYFGLYAKLNEIFKV